MTDKRQGTEIAEKSSYYCGKYGYDPGHIAARLALVGLQPADHPLARRLCADVIAPHVAAIVDEFHAALATDPEFVRVLARGYDAAALKQNFCRYLLTLGQNFDRAEYFEERLRVGRAHARAGVPLALYQVSYSVLQRLILERYPGAVRADPALSAALTAFLLKITALDMSLAIETYHLSAVQELQESIDHLRNEARTLHQRIDTDPLTGLASREHTLGTIETALRELGDTGPPLFIAMADLDLFKSINDTRGHLVGDAVLRGVAARIQSAVRDFDTVGRYGGEEFLVVLERTSALTARKIAERVRRHVASEPIHAGGQAFHITISIGLVNALPGDSLEGAIARADAAMYHAKQHGRNCVVMELRPGGGLGQSALPEKV